MRRKYSFLQINQLSSGCRAESKETTRKCVRSASRAIEAGFWKKILWQTTAFQA
jgi:hypothetical protein